MTTTEISPTFRGLVCETLGQDLSVQSRPVPDAVPGSAVVRVLASAVTATSKDIFDGKLPYISFPTPLIPGNNGVGRVVSVGPDATTLKVGQLVLVEPFIRARDNADVQTLFGLIEGLTPESKKLMKDVWRDALWAEYARVPLENCYALNEHVLLGNITDGGLGYNVVDLPYMARHLVAYGGLRSIGLQAGETIIVAPATGTFGGSAVEVASAMGATVIAAGRNQETLKRLARSIPRVKTVQLTGDVERDAQAFIQFGAPDAFIDFSPGTITDPTHIKSAMIALKPYGRVSFMGGIPGDVSINYIMAMWKSLTIKGQFMYEREDVRGLIKLAETGVLKLGTEAGVEVLGSFGLNDWRGAMELAAKNPEWGKMIVFTP